MPTYTVPTQFIFSGEFYVEAADAEEDAAIVRQQCGMAIPGVIHSTAPAETVDWEFDMTPEKRITAHK